MSSHCFIGRRESQIWLAALSVFPLLLLRVTHSFYWCNTNIVAIASGSPPTQLQCNLISSPLFVLTLPHWFPSFLCLRSTCSHLHLYLDNALILSASLFLFCLHTSFCLFSDLSPVSRRITSPAHRLTYIPASGTVEAVRLVFTEHSRSVPSFWVSGDMLRKKSLPSFFILSLSCPTATCQRLTRTTSHHPVKPRGKNPDSLKTKTVWMFD